MSPIKRHQFVPSSYLARFVEADSDSVYLLDKNKREIRKQKPGDIMFSKQHFKPDWVPGGIDKNILERRVGEFLETEAKSAIDKLINEPYLLTDDDSAVLLTYLEMQKIRVPRQVNVGKEMMKAFIQFSAHWKPEKEDEQPTGEAKRLFGDTGKYQSMKMFLAESVLRNFFSRMTWRILAAPKSTPLITTDRPVSFYNPMVPPPDEAGIGFLGTTVFFPLSPSYLLELRHPGLDGMDESRFLEKVQVEETGKSLIKIELGYHFTDELASQINFILSELANRWVVGSNESVLLNLIS
jgi:hypothetical protein